MLQLPRIIRDSHKNIAYQSATLRITLGLLSAMAGGGYFMGCGLDP